MEQIRLWRAEVVGALLFFHSANCQQLWRKTTALNWSVCDTWPIIQHANSISAHGFLPFDRIAAPLNHLKWCKTEELQYFWCCIISFSTSTSEQFWKLMMGKCHTNTFILGCFPLRPWNFFCLVQTIRVNWESGKHGTECFGHLVNSLRQGGPETILNALENVFSFLMWILLIYELISWVLV